MYENNTVFRVEEGCSATFLSNSSYFMIKDRQKSFIVDSLGMMDKESTMITYLCTSDDESSLMGVNSDTMNHMVERGYITLIEDEQELSKALLLLWI